MKEAMNIIWNPKTMSTGVPEVDAQHQEWIWRFNEFDTALHQSHGADAVQAALNFFSKYADNHFKMEEACMDARHCSAAQINREDHARMRSILAGYQRYTSQHGFSMIEVASLRQIMEDWLVKHILTIDIQLRDT